MSMKIRDDRQLRALTGLNREQFEILSETFGNAHAAMKERAYRQGLAEGTRKRRPGGGKKEPCPPCGTNCFFCFTILKYIRHLMFSEPCSACPVRKRMKICTDSVRFCMILLLI